MGGTSTRETSARRKYILDNSADMNDRFFGLCLACRPLQIVLNALLQIFNASQQSHQSPALDIFNGTRHKLPTFPHPHQSPQSLNAPPASQATFRKGFTRFPSLKIQVAPLSIRLVGLNYAAAPLPWNVFTTSASPSHKKRFDLNYQSHHESARLTAKLLEPLKSIRVIEGRQSEFRTPGWILPFGFCNAPFRISEIGTGGCFSVRWGKR